MQVCVCYGTVSKRGATEVYRFLNIRAITDVVSVRG